MISGATNLMGKAQEQNPAAADETTRRKRWAIQMSDRSFEGSVCGIWFYRGAAQTTDESIASWCRKLGYEDGEVA